MADANRLAGSTTFVSGELFNVTSTFTFAPRNTDDGVTFICQSSFSGEPFLKDRSNVALELACEYALQSLISFFNNRKFI